MLPNKLVTLCLRPQIISYISLRHIRGGRTIALKIQKPKVKEFEVENLRRKRDTIRSNPGAGHVLHAIQKRKGKLDPDLTEEYLEDMVIGSEDVHSKMKENLTSAYSAFDRKSLSNIKRKYFKEDKLPNMVPYCEKQDMKLLNESDPENWDVEKLSESFPVTPEIARKILRSPFTARTVKQVKDHDETVKRNWKLFKEGKLDLSPELRNHYEKFVDRVSFETREHAIKKYLPPEPNFEMNLKYKEFGSIIEKYQQTKQTNVQIEEDSKKLILENVKVQPKIIPEERRHSNLVKSVTLDKYRERLKNDPKQASELSKLIVETEEKYLPAPEPKVEIIQETDYLAEATIVDSAYQNSLPSTEDDYPLRIEIPKKMWKRNKVYQVKDRFYSHTGHFLYRVPGLFS